MSTTNPETQQPASPPTAVAPILTSAFAEDYIKAQAQFKKPTLNRTADVKKDGRLLYQTKYADLEECFNCIVKALTDNGFSFNQKTVKRRNEWLLLLTVRHKSGEFDEAEMPMTFSGMIQQTGGTLTYLKRYQVAAYFGLAADFDDDGNGGTGNDVTFSGHGGQSRPAQQQQQQQSKPQQNRQQQQQQNKQAPAKQNQQQQGQQNKGPANDGAKDGAQDPKKTTGGTAPQTPVAKPGQAAPKPAQTPTSLNTAPRSISTAQKEAITKECELRGFDPEMYLDPRTLDFLSQQAAYETIKELRAQPLPQ